MFLGSESADGHERRLDPTAIQDTSTAILEPQPDRGKEVPRPPNHARAQTGIPSLQQAARRGDPQPPAAPRLPLRKLKQAPSHVGRVAGPALPNWGGAMEIGVTMEVSPPVTCVLYCFVMAFRMALTSACQERSSAAVGTSS